MAAASASTSASAGAGAGAGTSGGEGVGSGYGSLRDKELGEMLIKSGTKLMDPPSATEELLKQLDDLESKLSIVSQAPMQILQDCLLPAMRALIATKLLRHTDTDVKASVAVCINEIIRITAPDAPYNDDEMKECFQLTITALEKLSHSSSRSYIKAISILETIARVRSCLMMLDLECDAFVIEIFQLFLKIIRSNHPNPVFSNMETIMTLLIEENEDICINLLTTLLDSVKKENQHVLPVALKLGEKVIKNCAAKLKPYFVKAIKAVQIDVNDYVPLVSSICNDSYDETEPNHVIVREEQRVEVASGLSLDVRAEEPCPGCSLEAAYNKEKETSGSNVGTSQNKEDATLDGNIGVTESIDREVLDGNDDNVTYANKKPNIAQCSESNPSESSEATLNQESDKREIAGSVKSDMEPERVLRKRGLRPNCSINPDEGYEHFWMGGSEPRSRRKRNFKARVNTLSTDDNKALVVVPEDPQTGTVGATPTANCSIPEEYILERRKKKRSNDAAAEVSQSVTVVTTEKLETGSFSSDKTEGGSMAPREQTQSVSTSACTLPDSSVLKKRRKKQSMVRQHDAETSQIEAVVSPPKTQTETDTVLEKSQTMTIILPEESQSGTISLNGGPPDRSQLERRMKKKNEITGKDAKTSQTVTIVLPKDSLSNASGASANPEDSIPGGSLLETKRKENGGSGTVQDADGDFPSAKKKCLVSIQVEDSEDSREKYPDSQLTSPKVSQTVITQSISTPACNNLPAEKSEKAVKLKNKGTEKKQSAVDFCSSVAIKTSEIPESSNPGLLKIKRKEKGSNPKLQDEDEDSLRANKKRLISTIEDKAAGPLLQKHANSQLISPEVSQTVITQSKPTSYCDKLSAEETKDVEHSKKKSTVTEPTADVTYPSIPEKDPSSSHVRYEPAHDAELITVIESSNTGTLAQNLKTNSLHSQKNTHSVNTMVETAVAPQDAAFKEGGQSGHGETLSIQPFMNESSKIAFGEGSSAPVKKRGPGRPKKTATEKILDSNVKEETKRKTPAKKVPRKPCNAEEARALVGKRIKIWWPRDKTFYEGTVTEYDYYWEKHRIVYTDRVVEVLNLRAQIWELIEEEDNNTPTEPALEANTANGDEASTDKIETAAADPEDQSTTVMANLNTTKPLNTDETVAANPGDQSTTMMANLNTTKPLNTEEIPDSNVPSESCGLETLSNAAEEPSTSKKRRKKREKFRFEFKARTA